MKRSFLIMLAVTVFMAMFLVACQSDDHSSEDNHDIEINRYLYCPIDNAAISEMPIRPVVVTIDNAPKARPQSGLMDADLLYEIPAEGGVSRFLAVFYHGVSDKIGPIRSARPYLVDIAREWQGVYVHVGGSPDALSYLANGNWPYINEFSHGSYFWRDKSRRAPHNLYTSSENLWQDITAKGWDEEKTVTAWPFLSQSQTQMGDIAADVIKINYSSAKNTYKYDSREDVYWREIANKPHVDADSGEQLAVKNVIVQYVTSRVLDSAGRLSIDMTGEGDALLFSGGIVKKGFWKRPGLDYSTIFMDEEGNEWKMSSGKTFIQVVDQTVKVSYEDTTQTQSE
ncbi:MAG: DUF3048 domain-containing protein [Bacillota bacterium]|jgi:hypothetical protein